MITFSVLVTLPIVEHLGIALQFKSLCGVAFKIEVWQEDGIKEIDNLIKLVLLKGQ